MILQSIPRSIKPGCLGERAIKACQRSISPCPIRPGSKVGEAPAGNPGQRRFAVRDEFGRFHRMHCQHHVAPLI
jgi:hypothetical protein